MPIAWIERMNQKANSDGESRSQTLTADCSIVCRKAGGSALSFGHCASYLAAAAVTAAGGGVADNPLNTNFCTRVPGSTSAT